MAEIHLITAVNIIELSQNGVLIVQRGQILTPGAKDTAAKKGIKIIYGEGRNERGKCAAFPVVKLSGDQVEQKDNPASAIKEELSENSIQMPSLNLFGFGCLSKAAARAKALGYRNGLLVTDATLRKVGMADTVIKVLEQEFIGVVVYEGVQPNPTLQNVNEGLALLTSHGCDFVISLGGGSPHDCAKAIALLATNGGNLEDYEGVNKLIKQSLPMVAINTTAGTASEMTRFCIITNEESRVKMAIVDPCVTPAISVNDPALMMAMPASLTSATGVDALTHAIEAYLATNANPITDAVACKAIAMITEYLPRAVHHGDDVEAREQMAYAQFMAGVAFNSAGLGYVHAMAHQLGGQYGLPHGVCNAVLLPHVLVHNLPCCESRLADIARHMGCEVAGMEDRAAAVEGIKKICHLITELKLPTSLESLGVNPEDIPVMADNALKDACARTSPRTATSKQIEGIFFDAM